MKLLVAAGALMGVSAINIKKSALAKLTVARKTTTTRKIVKVVRKGHVSEPTITEESNGEPTVTEVEGECRCPVGEFWHNPANDPDELSGVAGSCLTQYGLGDECGAFPIDVQPRVCQDGLVCRPTASHDEDDNTESGTPLNGAYTEAGSEFGMPAKCESCTQEDEANGLCKVDAAADHASDCAKTALVEGQYCAKVTIAAANCGDAVTGEMAAAHHEASADASATATASATVPGPDQTVEVCAENAGNTACVQEQVPGQDVTVTEEVTVEQSATASATVDPAAALASGEITVNGKGEAEVCVTAAEALEHHAITLEDGKMTVRQAHVCVDAMRGLAHERALTEAMSIASDDACAQAQDQAQQMAQAQADAAAANAAAAAADGAAADAAAAASDATAAAVSPDAAGMSPEQQAQMQAQAEQAAAAATAAGAATSAQSAGTTAQSGQMADANPAGASEAPPTPGVKQPSVPMP